jgi:hypothetical protein
VPRAAIDAVRDEVEAILSGDEGAIVHANMGLIGQDVPATLRLAKAIAVAAAELVDESERARVNTVALQSEIASLRMIAGTEGIANRAAIDTLTKAVANLTAKMDEILLAMPASPTP